ncbi:hypothetical protein CAPTEDRAFT_219816 [Capitella teleta]|uniref:Store-operated calcium entry-associated regulatory factor n=1 Tax=Capitella teleta TaxID=283909 RepID=R7TVZ9_CAPTE|nr:hypothetical protein CAPTEDRAFT_219816 [Capitella teleta]|eukprot:ELT97879.1 hypothetical protein CAPTEDRAFT_219816 [Capitella teleta]
MYLLILFVAAFVATLCPLTAAWGSSGNDRVLLSDIKTLTLYNGKMTTGRRSSPVAQLTCTGGTAGCSSYVPPVVQCRNQGTDGYDIQWECKADLDNAYRFGKIEVTCEGYDHPDDPYILRGSCGLEYSLEMTKEGYQQQHTHNSHQQSGYHGHNSHGGYFSNHHGHKKGSSWMGDLILLAIVGVIIYAIYYTCIAPPPQQSAGTGTGSTPRYPGGPPSGPRGSPPPYGFRDDYSQGGGGCSDTYGGQSYSSGTPGANAGGGFWTGAATGGLMGYLFGSRTNQSYHHAPTNSWGSGWGGSRTTYSTPSFGGSSRGFGGGSFGGGGSTGTRTASGFGGTRRR